MRLTKQKGAILLTLIIALTLMTALGVGINSLTTSSTFSELLATRDYNAYHLAKAGMRYAAFNRTSNPQGDYCMSGGRCFTISKDDSDPAFPKYTVVGKVNQNTFLAAYRQLAYNFSISAAPWEGPNKSPGTPDTLPDGTPGKPNIQINAVPNTVIEITAGPDGDVTTPDDNTVTIGRAPGGGLASDSYGSFCFQIPSTNGNCGADGKCDFGYGVNAFFEFQFLLADNNGNSQNYADGFTFAMMSGINNTKERTGGKGGGISPDPDSEGELMGYSGPGNTTTAGTALVKDGLGWKPPKIALEFDTYPNQEGLSPIGWCADEGARCYFEGRRSVAYGATTPDGVAHYNYLYDIDPSMSGSDYINCNNATFGDPIVGTVKACYLLPTNICDPGSRNDQSVHNHAAIMFWGSNSAAVTDMISRNCTAGSPAVPVSSVSFDDNMHGAGIGTDPQNSVTASTTLGGGTGYYRTGTVNWLEDRNKYSVRMEIVRTDTGGTGNYATKAWVVLSDSLGSTQSLFQDVTLPFTGTPTYNTSRTVNLSAQDHSNFSKTLVCITTASGQPGLGGQSLELSNFKYFFPEQAGACSYALTPASATYAAAGGSGSFAVASTSTCYWEASSLASWITINSGKYGRGNGTVNYTVAAYTSFTPRTGYISIGGQTFMVTQLGQACTYALSSSDNSATPLGATTGRTGTVTLTAGSGCPWTTSNNGNTWITVTSASGTGTGSPQIVTYTASTNTGPERNATIIIGGQNFQVYQASGCTYNLDDTSDSGISISGATNQLAANVDTTSSCPWTATSNAAWTTVTSPTGTVTGDGLVRYNVAANNGPQRTGTITIAGQNFTVTQNGCTYTLDDTSDSSISAGGATYQLAANVDTSSSCQWTATSNAAWITVTSPTGTVTGDSSVRYNVAANNGPQRTGTITIAGQNFTVTQNGGCTYSFGACPSTFPAGGGNASISVNTATGCTWVSSDTRSWISTSPTSSSGAGSVAITVNSHSPGSRSGSVSIDGTMGTTSSRDCTIQQN